MTISAFLLALIAIFTAARIFGEIAQRLGQPAVLGELIGGILVGVSGLRLVPPHGQTIQLLSQLGVIILLFLIGLETDLKRLLSVAGSATAVAVVGVALPFAGGMAAGHFLGFSTMVAVFLGASLTATSVGITARVLSDLGHLHDDESQVILGAAVVDDILGLVLLTLISIVAEGERLTTMSVLRVVGTAFGFVVAAIVIGSWLAPYLIRAIERIDIARGLFFASMMFAFLLAYIAQQAGSAIIIGAFSAGLVLSRTEHAEQIEREVHDIGQVFVPIFFVVVGAAVDLASINPFSSDARRFFLIGLILTAVGVAGKVLAGFATLKRGMKRSIIGVGMIPRGEVGLVFAQIGLSAKLLTSGLYSAVAMMVILTTLMTPLLLRAMLARREREELRTGRLVTDALNDGERRRSDRRGSPGAVEVP